MEGTAPSPLSRLLSPRLLGQARPIALALIAIAICVLLFRPRRKPPALPGAPGAANTNAAPATRGPQISVSTVGVLLDFEGGGGPRLFADAASTLKRLAQRADLYLLTTLPEDSDALEAATLKAMSSGGLFAEGGCDQRKALFCNTEGGRSAMARQLNPSVHIDTSPKVLQYLAPHLPRVVYVNATGAPMEGAAAGSVVLARSLTEYVQGARDSVPGA